MEHPEAIPRFPLAWPMGWPRSKSRGQGAFSQTKTTVREDGQKLKSSDAVTLQTAVDRLERQVDLLGGQGAVLSTNVQLRMDGRPKGNVGEPYDPGAALYFRFKGRATVMACDRYERVADNIAAIAAHIDALRRIDRYGVGNLEQALAGYKALPADSAADWRAVLGLKGRPSVADVESAFKKMARDRHPDIGGNQDGFVQIQRAREFALAELNGGH